MSTLSHARPGAGIVWSLVEDGFHVGSRNGDFLGYIEQKRDGYHAVNMYSQPIGVFSDLAAAMTALSTDLPVVPTRSRGRWAFRR